MKIYAVRHGRKTGIFYSWEECLIQIDKYPMAQYRSFTTLESAMAYLDGINIFMNKDIDLENNLYIFTDGSWNTKTNKGAYGFWIPQLDKLDIIETTENTNNKNELLAIKISLDYLEKIENKKKLVFIVDSKYVVQIFSSWLEKWIKNNLLENKAHKEIILEIYIKLIKFKNSYQFQHIHSHTNNLDYLSLGNDKIDKEVQKFTCF
jgi:viroplasmin and RNaseH domain-containing protein